jgi:hypothetical protein
MRASGQIGQLRVGYRLAAKLGAWSLSMEARIPRIYTMRARVEWRDVYWLTQAPLDLALDIGGVEWLWRGIRAALDGDDVVVTVRDRPIVGDRQVDIKTGEHGLWPKIGSSSRRP